MSMTLQELIDCYRTDSDSNFQKLRFEVRVKSGRLFDRLVREHGSDRLQEIRLRSIMGWYRQWTKGGKNAMGHAFINRLRELFRFGCTLLEEPDCFRLFESLSKFRFEGTPLRRAHMTADHARAFCKTARTHFGWHSIALVQALQFELSLGQKDVIGEWVPVGEPGDSYVVANERKWLRGVTWSAIDENFVLRHKVGSSGRLIEADLRTAPMVIDELKLFIGLDASSPADLPPRGESFPADGPMALCDTNALPWTSAEFRRKWRLVAKKAGVPDNITNLRRRASN